MSNPISDFIEKQILGKLSFDQFEVLKKHIEKRSSEGIPLADSFCDYLELGNWFYEAIDVHSVNIESLIDKVETDMIISAAMRSIAVSNRNVNMERLM